MDAAAGNQGTICCSYYNLVNGYKVIKICKVIPFEFIHISHHPIMCAAPALSFITEMYSFVAVYCCTLQPHLNSNRSTIYSFQYISVRDFLCYLSFFF